MERRKIWDIIILLLAFIISVSFPIGSLTDDVTLIRVVKIGFLVIFILFAILFIYFTKIAHLYQGNINHKNGFLLSPLFLVSFCNLFYIIVVNRGTLGNPNWSDTNFILDIILALLTAFAEELAFRFVLEKNLPFRSKVNKILVASAVFAACHILTIFSGWNLAHPDTWHLFDLSMIFYTFFIGVCLGFLYEYTNNLILPIAFHFIFNFFNDTLTSAFITEWTIPYFINCLCFGIYGIGYICLFYFVFTKRENR